MTLKKLDLDDFFYELRNEIYCIVKISDDFPLYSKGSDVDIFCYDIKKISDVILSVGNQYIEYGYKISVSEKHNSKQVHIDFILKKQIEFRFDLYNSMPHYKNVAVKDSLFESIIENARGSEGSFNEKIYTFFIPSVIDELLLRYIEYIEYYFVRPDKIKHLDYILREVSQNNERISFLDKLHRYTKIPDTKIDNSQKPKSGILYQTLYAHKKIKNTPIKKIPPKLFQKLFKK